MKKTYIIFAILIIIQANDLFAAASPVGNFLSDRAAMEKSRELYNPIFTLSLNTQSPIIEPLPFIGVYKDFYVANTRLASLEVNPEACQACAPERLKQLMSKPNKKFYIIVTGNNSQPGKTEFNYVMHPFIKEYRRKKGEDTIDFNIPDVAMGMFDPKNVSGVDLPTNSLTGLSVHVHPIGLYEAFSPNNAKFRITSQVATFWFLAQWADQEFIAFNILLDSKELSDSFAHDVNDRSNDLEGFLVNLDTFCAEHIPQASQPVFRSAIETIGCCVDPEETARILAEAERRRIEEEAERLRIAQEREDQRQAEKLARLTEEFNQLETNFMGLNRQFLELITWQCPVCTLRNPRANAVCSLCQSPPPIPQEIDFRAPAESPQGTSAALDLIKQR